MTTHVMILNPKDAPSKWSIAGHCVSLESAMQEFDPFQSHLPVFMILDYVGQAHWSELSNQEIAEYSFMTGQNWKECL